MTDRLVHGARENRMGRRPGTGFVRITAGNRVELGTARADAGSPRERVRRKVGVEDQHLGLVAEQVVSQLVVPVSGEGHLSFG